MLDDPRLPERFWEKVSPEPNSGCWLWAGAKQPNGYGAFSFSQTKSRTSHRISYEVLVGPVQRGLELDHLCRVRSCCNPDHLEPVTHSENVKRGMAQRSLIPVYKRRREETHCIRDHEFTEENTYWHRGRRQCKSCKLDAVRRWRESKG